MLNSCELTKPSEQHEKTKLMVFSCHETYPSETRPLLTNEEFWQYCGQWRVEVSMETIPRFWITFQPRGRQLQVEVDGREAGLNSNPALGRRLPISQRQDDSKGFGF